MPKATKKYRPYFTMPQLKALSNAAAFGEHSSDELKEVKKYLDSFIYEIEKGYRTASHITNPRPTIEERLGVDSPGNEHAGPTIAEIQAEEARLFGGES